VRGQPPLRAALKHDLDTVLTEINVPPGHRGRGVGSALWDWAAFRAKVHGRSIFQVEVNIPEGQTARTWAGAVFAGRRNFTIGNVEDRLIVGLPFAAHLLADLEAPVAGLTGYRTVSWVDACPQEHLQSFADLNTEMSTDVPTGTVTRHVVVYEPERIRLSEQRMAPNWTTLTTLAVAEDGTGGLHQHVPATNRVGLRPAGGHARAGRPSRAPPRHTAQGDPPAPARASALRRHRTSHGPPDLHREEQRPDAEGQRPLRVSPIEAMYEYERTS